MKEASKEPIVAVSCGKPERASWSRDNYVVATISVYPAYMEKGSASGFADYDHQWNVLDRYYCGLQYTATISGDFSNDERPTDSYELAYRQPYEVKLSKAQKMYKTLARIDRLTEKLALKFGQPESFGGHATRFGNAIGAKQAWIWEAEQRGHLIPIGDLVAFLDKNARRLSIECRLKGGKYEGIVKGWTNAPEDYDGFGTKTMQTLDSGYREVSIEGNHYLWQIGRYQSGMKSFLSDDEFRKQIA